MFDVKGKKALVVGFGISGQEAARLLLDKGAMVKITDSGTDALIEERLLNFSENRIQTEIGNHSDQFVDGVDFVVVSPGIPLDSEIIHNCRKRNLPIMSELELGFRFCRAPIVAITGTNGKSTTTELIGNILKTAGIHTIVCGNIGNPISGEIKYIQNNSIVVAEVSSFQLETIHEFKPYISVLLNVSDDHYDRHKDLETYKNEKVKIFQNQNNKDWAVLNSEFKKDAFVPGIKSNICYYGDDSSEARLQGNEVTIEWDGKKLPIMNIKDIPLKGIHNIENVEASILVSKIIGVKDKDIYNCICSFNALRHRFEKIGIFNEIEFIDDSKATNIDAACYALRSVEKKVVLIAGGIDKGGDYSSSFADVKRVVKSIVAIGEAKNRLKEVFSHIVDVHEARDMRDAVERSINLASRGDIVMLSPMCSSFDMFSGYKERGEVFQREVREYYK